jgi:hypothetical protein
VWERALYFGTARKNVDVRARVLNLALRGVHTHNNGARGVCSIAECRGVWLVPAQYEYKLSHDSVVNGVRRLMVRGRGVLNFGMVQHVE